MMSKSRARSEGDSILAENLNHESEQVKLDKHGLPLVPQPTDHPDDPLNWPLWQRTYVAFLVALLGFMSKFGSSLINPAFEPLSKSLHVTLQQALYCTTVFILFGGVSPIFIVPFANVYGRRIIYIVSTLIAAVGSFVSAAAPNYGGVLVGRVLNGIGSSIPLSIGAATICDLFPQGERGFFMGIYTFAVTNGPHIAPIAGGYISQNMGWRWSFWIPGIIQASLCILLTYTLPETLFSRIEYTALKKRSYTTRLTFHGKILDRPIRLSDFALSFRMAKYAAVILPGIYYATADAYGSVIFAVTGSNLAKTVYKFNVEQTGLLMGVPITIGCIIGEASAGWVSDFAMSSYARRHNGYLKPEARLYLIPLCFLLPIGTATYGFCVQHHRPWIEAAVCMAIAGMGTQVGATMTYTYSTDSYKPQAVEVGAIINFIKAVFAFNIGFYALPFGERVGFAASFATLAAINAFLLLPLVFLIFAGEAVRKRQGLPNKHQDL